MKQFIILFSILILLLPIAAAETEIFSGKILTGAEKDIDGDIFKFTYDSFADKAFVQTSSTGLIVDNGACKSNEVFKVCIDAANFSHKNITTQVYYYDIDTTIYKLTGSLTADTTITSSELLQGESAELKVTIKNPTNFEITDIDFYHDLGPFTIEKLEGCALSGNSMVWQGSLKPGFDRVCTATIVSFNESTYKLSGNLSYFNSYETETKTTDTVTITVLKKQLETIQTIDKYIEIKQPFYYSISFNNIHVNENLDASVVLEFPDNIRFLRDTSGFFGNNNILKRNLKIQPETRQNYSFYLEATSEGSFQIKQNIVYTINNVKDTIENKTSITVTDPKPVIEFISEYIKVIPGQKFIVVVQFKNPSRFNELTDINIKLRVPYNNVIKDSLWRLKQNESYSSISQTFIIPENIELDADSEVLMSINLSIDYKLKGLEKSISESLDLILKKELTEEDIIDEANLNDDTKITQEETNETTDDIVVTKGIGNETTETELQSTDITKEQPGIIRGRLMSSFLNGDILLIIGTIFVVFIIVVFIVTMVRKKKIRPTELDKTGLKIIEKDLKQ